jgi:hyperosmotically inducible protein
MKTKHECKPMNLSDSVFIVAMSAVLGLGLPGCQQEGTAEKAGQKIDQAAENAGKKLEATKESLAGKTESAAGYLDDSAITAKIKAEILSTPLLKSSQITVTTTNGVVTLGGTVDSQQSIVRALQIARASQNVKSVESSLAVKDAK